MRDLRNTIQNDDAGFTLVELLVATVIMGIIIGPLTGVLLLGLGTATASKAKETHSSDEQLVTSYFDSDVQSSKTVTTGSFCGGTGAQVVFNWADPSGPGTAFQVAYVLDATTLLRVVCKNGAEARRVEVAREVTASQAECSYPPALTFGACAAAKPSRVRLSITESSGEVQAETYTFSLTATRRVEA